MGPSICCVAIEGLGRVYVVVEVNGIVPRAGDSIRLMRRLCGAVRHRVGCGKRVRMGWRTEGSDEVGIEARAPKPVMSV